MEAIAPFLLEQGLPGAMILALGWFSFNRISKIDELTEARIAENRLVLEAINANTSALKELTNLIRDRRTG